MQERTKQSVVTFITLHQGHTSSSSSSSSPPLYNSSLPCERANRCTVSGNLPQHHFARHHFPRHVSRHNCLYEQAEVTRNALQLPQLRWRQRARACGCRCRGRARGGVDAQGQWGRATEAHGCRQLTQAAVDNAADEGERGKVAKDVKPIIRI